MDKTQLLVAIATKSEDLRAQAREADAAGKSSGKIKRNARALEVIESLIETYCEDTEDIDFPLLSELQQMIDCKKGRSGVKLEVHEGDTLMELLNKYSSVKDVYSKIKTACDQQGLKIVLDHIERA